MIIVNDLCLTFGTRAIFDHISLTIQDDQKVGLVGRNGAGKSTFLKAVAGVQAYDSGSISIERGKRIAYMPQESVLVSTKNVLDEALTAFEEAVKLQAELADIESRLEDADEAMLDRYTTLLHQCSTINLSAIEVQTRKILKGLGFPEATLTKPVDQLSVGWKMRLVLAKLLLQDADLYLFDEPTNHLDIVAKDWFLGFLKSANFGYLLVSHDRYFLDHACDNIIEIDRGSAKPYASNYTKYLEQKAHDTAMIERAYAQQQKEIAQKTATINRFKASANKASMMQSMQKKLDAIDRIEIDTQPDTVAFTFPPPSRPGRIVLDVKDVNKSFGEKVIFKNVSFSLERGQKAALVAANGVGKTTLLTAIMGKTPVDSGEIVLGYNVTPAWFEQDQEKSLDQKATVLDEVEDSCVSSEARSRVRAMLGAFLFPGDDVHKKIGVLSGGEKNRVAMTKVLLAPANLLVLDEPTNHLDLQSKEILLSALQQYQGTMLLVSHDRSFLDALTTHIIELTPTGARVYEGNYETYLYQKNCQSGLSSSLVEEKKQKPSHVESIKKEEKNQQGGKEAYEARKRRASLEKKVEKLEAERTSLQQDVGMVAWGSDKHTKLEERLNEVSKQLGMAYKEWEQLPPE